MNKSLQHSLHILERIEDMLHGIGEENYCRRHVHSFDATVGEHVRHVIEFYQLYIQSSEAQVLDYNNRERNTVLENDPNAAIAAITKIREELTELVETKGDGDISVISDSGAVCSSSRARELEFLGGHTIHHNAIIVSMCESMSVSVDSEMAFAPSTLANAN